MEFHYFMKKEYTQLKTKQRKQNIINQSQSMGFTKLSVLESNSISKRKSILELNSI